MYQAHQCSAGALLPVHQHRGVREVFGVICTASNPLALDDNDVILVSASPLALILLSALSNRIELRVETVDGEGLVERAC